MILFVDDERCPTTGMFERAGMPRYANIFLARTSQDAISQLKRSTAWQAMWLDHDLGGDDTGMKVVDCLCELAFDGLLDPRQFCPIFIHTQNPVGRDNIERALLRYDFDVRHVYL